MDRNPWIPHAPHPKQRQFLLLADVREVMYGGAARGGKSDALLMAAAQFVEVPGYAALILRETFADLNKADALIPRSKAWWLGTKAGWSEKFRRWTFPSGATIEFGYLDNDNDVYQYQSAAFQMIGIDELTHHTEFRYTYMFSRLTRPKDGPLAGVPVRMRSGTNPGGRGHDWVKKRFVDPRTRHPGAVFVPAKLEDNPSTDQEDYDRSTAHLDPVTRAQLRRGDWDAVEGGRFKREWFRWFRHEETGFVYSPTWRFLTEHRPKFFTIDFASSTKTTADYTVVAVWCLSPANDLVWLDCARVQFETPDLVPLVQRMVRKWSPGFVGVEAVGSNNALLQFLQRSKDPIITTMQLSPMGNDKLVRATPAMCRVSEGRVYLPEDDPAFPLDDVLGELCRFTGDPKKDGKDDVVDVLSYACELLPKIGAMGGPGSAPTSVQSRAPTAGVGNRTPPGHGPQGPHAGTRSLPGRAVPTARPMRRGG